MARTKRDAETFRRGVIVVSFLAFVVRAAYILIVRRDADIQGDSFFYHYAAHHLAEGHGFVEPLNYAAGFVEQSANHPPLYTIFLTIPTVVGLEGPVAHMLWSSLVGTGTVIAIALLGREVAGARAGVIAGGLAAVYPNLWVYDGFILSETIAIFMVVITVLLAYRYRREPALRRAAWLGAAAGLAALARTELVLLLPFLVAPLVWRAARIDISIRLRWLLVAGLVAATLMAPWVAFNLVRFHHPVLLSTGFEPTIAGANCDATYYGPSIGYFSNECLQPARDRLKPTNDQSERGVVYREIALDYVSNHKRRVPVVVLARWGRVTGLFNPSHQLLADEIIEGREHWTARASLFSFYVVAVLAVAGAIVLRRRRTLLYPLLVPPIIVALAVAVALGSNRYRASAEGMLTVLAAVSVDAALAAWSGRRRESSAPHGTRGRDPNALQLASRS